MEFVGMMNGWMKKLLIPITMIAATKSISAFSSQLFLL